MDQILKMRRFITSRHFILASLLFAQLSMQSQISIFPNLAGDELITEIVKDYKPASVLDYGDARDIMYGAIYNINGKVTCVYSGHSIDLPTGEDPTAFLYMNGSNDGINAEHTYPRSKGAEFGNPLSDMHHLFPTRAAVNAGRGNSPFGEINDNQTTKWYYLDDEQGNIPNTNIDLYSEEINGKFEPKENHKGNAARSVFYFFSMYRDAALDADPNFFESQRETLCDWHNQDPVDELELERTYMIAEHQDDQPNPYILDSTLASRAFCGALPTSIKETGKSKVSIFPNPVQDYIQIISTGKSSLQLIDILGRLILDKQFFNDIKIDCSSLHSGNYFVLINGEVFKIFKM